MNLRRTWLWALLGLGSLLATGTAQAQEQPWLRDSRLTNGPGVKGNKLDYNAGLAASFMYDSNVFLRAGTASEPRADAFKLNITPYVTVSTREPSDGERPAYAFAGQAALSYYEFFSGLKTTERDDVSGHRNFGALAGLALTIAPGQRWSGELQGGFARTIQPSNLGDPTASFNRMIPTAGVSLSWRPGGGLFVWRVIGYDFAYNYFEASRFHRYDNMVHTVGTSTTWRFLPRTSLFNESKVSFIRYTDSDTEQSNGDSASTRFGVNGLVTNHVGFLAAAGWASTFFGERPGSQIGKQDFDSFLAQAEARFYLSTPEGSGDTPGVSPSILKLGYLRDWQQSYIGNFYGRDRAYGSLSYFLGGVVLTTINAGVAWLHFPASEFEGGQARNSAFTNVAIDAGGFVEYRVMPNLGINGNVQYTQMLSDTIIRAEPNNPQAGGDNLKWTRVEAVLGLRYML